MTKYFYLTLALIAFILSSCSTKHDNNVLVVSIEPQRQLLEAIVGDKYNVETILPSGANPESFEITLKTRKDVDRAQAYFTVGTLPFESSITETLPDNVVTVNCSEDIPPIFGTHGDHHHGNHHHDGVDPHTWTSVKNMRLMAAKMIETIEKIDPKNQSYYRQRYQTLDRSLDSLDHAFATQLATAPRHVFAVWHPSLSYLARDYNLNQISVGYENKEISPSRMATMIENARSAGVRDLFFQQQFDSRQVESLNSSLGANITTFNPLDYDWQSQLQSIVSALCAQR